jgi:hypothetical protein
MAPPIAPFSRAAARVPFTAPVTLMAGETAHRYPGMYDISVNGALIRTVRPLPPGALASFSIHLAVGMRKETIEGQCQVVRVISVDDGLCGEEPGPGMGIKFLELAGGGAGFLHRLILHNSP